MKKYSITYPEDLRSLCIRKNWFTCGSIRQYDKLFQRNDEGASVEEIATIIWICSSEEHSKEEILAELNEVHEEYLMSIAEAQIAAGERAADETYCGYFD